jgi:hypothetical protein
MIARKAKNGGRNKISMHPKYLGLIMGLNVGGHVFQEVVPPILRMEAHENYTTLSISS